MSRQIVFLLRYCSVNLCSIDIEHNCAFSLNPWLIYLILEQCTLNTGGEVTLVNPKVPIDNIKALSVLVSFDPSKAATEFLPKIDRDICLVVNIESVGNDFRDGNSWKPTKGKQVKTYQIENGIVTLSRNGYEVFRTPYIHSSCPQLKRVIVYSENPQKVLSELAIVQYRFDGPPQLVVNKPHGYNKTDTTPHVPTKQTTIQQIASELKETNSNKRIQHEVKEANGGLMASSPVNIPRNTRQVKYVREREKNPVVDPILELLRLQNEDDIFIQQAIVKKNSQIVLLYNKEQLYDLERFCAPEREIQASTLACDMTFKLGDFWVVITQYHNLHVLIHLHIYISNIKHLILWLSNGG